MATEIPVGQMEDGQTAAAKVFAVPELLEHILLGYAEKEASMSSNSPFLKGPVKALYVWQRVDKTTRNIIMGSRKLRCYMLIEFLEDESEEAKVIRGNHFQPSRGDVEVVMPLCWLLREVKKHLRQMKKARQVDKPWKPVKRQYPQGQSTLEVTNGEPGDGFLHVHLTPITITSRFEPVVLLSEAMLRPEASWRSIRIRHVDCGEDIYIDQHFELDWVAWYKEEFFVEGKVDEQMTLGEFFDWYGEGLERTRDEHREIVRELINDGVKTTDYYPEGECWNLEDSTERWGNLKDDFDE